MKNSRTTLRFARLAALALPIALVGCEWLGDRDSSSDPVVAESYGFDLVPTTREIAAGEMVTIATRSRNLIGRDTRVEWSATGGKIESDQSGSVARVTFDEPGAYTIRARLFVDGRPLEQDSVDIRVRPLRP